jgi:hypothetical protein
MSILPKINEMIECFGLLQQSGESHHEATRRNEPSEWGNNFQSVEATKTLENLIQINEMVFAKITSDEEAVLITRCLAALND